MPAIGLGTGGSSASSAEQMIPLLLDAIAAGYRHIDTAALYGTEEFVGRAVAEAVDRGLVKSRDELFITSKLCCTDTHHDLVLPAIQESLRYFESLMIDERKEAGTHDLWLDCMSEEHSQDGSSRHWNWWRMIFSNRKLGLQYVDLYLIHWPVRIKMDGNNSMTMMTFDIKETWEAMEDCCRLGLAKSIGVSNFSCAKLSKILEIATIPPAVNQVELNVAWQQRKLVEFCKEKTIHVSAFSPLGAYGYFWGTHAVMDSPVLEDIAAAKNKTKAQVALRWIYEQGVSPIVRSFNKERMKENIQIFDWELTDEEVHKIEQQIPQNRACTGKEFVCPDGQYKSLEQLWDGEI
ncbi:hypothetical protein DH2020_045710 [Rehmannia glutinosa]|uniref:NADP-dependent oxidoreductase domain-containing protein n=1 Tax=Rehmannia glutinosa TaxID=99300 RepID=A0ABR0UDD9_REHGL